MSLYITFIKEIKNSEDWGLLRRDNTVGKKKKKKSEHWFYCLIRNPQNDLGYMIKSLPSLGMEF